MFIRSTNAYRQRITLEEQSSLELKNTVDIFYAYITGIYSNRSHRRKLNVRSVLVVEVVLINYHHQQQLVFVA